MNEDEEPDGAEPAWTSEALARQLEPGIQAMARQLEPIIEAAQAMARQLEPIIRLSQAMARQLEPIVEASEIIARQLEPMIQAAAQLARAGAWPVPPFQQQLLRTVEAAITGTITLQPFACDANIDGSAALIRVVAPPGTVTGSAEVAVMNVAGQGIVQNPHSGRTERGVGQVLALVLVAMVAAGLLAVPARDQALAGYDLAVIGLALTVALAIWSKGK
jgi:hypothetical protein